MSTFIDMSYELWYDNLMIKDTNIRVTFVTTKDNKARLEPPHPQRIAARD